MQKVFDVVRPVSLARPCRCAQVFLSANPKGECYRSISTPMILAQTQ